MARVAAKKHPNFLSCRNSQLLTYFKNDVPVNREVNTANTTKRVLKSLKPGGKAISCKGTGSLCVDAEKMQA